MADARYKLSAALQVTVAGLSAGEPCYLPPDVFFRIAGPQNGIKKCTDDVKIINLIQSKWVNFAFVLVLEDLPDSKLVVGRCWDLFM